MKKLTLFLLLLISFNSIGQSISCDDLLDKIKYDGYKKGISLVIGSDAISNIDWYEYEDMLFAIVRFTSSYKNYVYGGWKYSSYSYINFKSSFENSNSKGTFFNQNIRSAKVDCY
jgi:hypothetical protein